MDSATPPAFCSRCKGVLPFNQEKRNRKRCARCGTLFQWVDPAAELSRRSWRYLLYAGAAAALVSSLEGLAAAVGLGHPDVLGLPFFPSMALATTAAGCLARSVALRLRAGTFERLAPFELARMDQKLCPGMIRADVVDGLFAAGWRPGKIRSALAGLRPAR